MRSIRSITLLLVIAAASAGCASRMFESFKADDGHYMKALPPKSQLDLVGEWDMNGSRRKDEFQHCTISIYSSNGGFLLVHDCAISSGCCSGTHGIVLDRLNGEQKYLDAVSQEIYEVQGDRSLIIRGKGLAERHFLATPRQDSVTN